MAEQPALTFVLTFVEPEAETAASASLGNLKLVMQGLPVWSSGREPWPMVEWLEHLAAQWTFLEWEERDPLQLGGDFSTVRARAQERWRDLPEAEGDAQDELLFGFERSHNLANAFQGMVLPDLWWVRQGACAWVKAGLSAAVVPWTTAREALQGTGDQIANRLRDVDDERARVARRAWDQRSNKNTPAVIEAALGVTARILEELAPREQWAELLEFDPAAPSELLVAARMAGPYAQAEDLRELMNQLKAQKATASPALTALSSGLPKLLGPPYEQGQAAAIWLRQHWRVAANKPIDPAARLRALGVRVREVTLMTTAIDAACAWGPRHGPVVLVNPKGRHASGVAGRRATLAHELGHLLMDRGGLLPVAEVKGGAVSEEAEARANAFAAELLLPQKEAAAWMARAEKRGAKAALAKLCRHYGVSKKSAAWQALKANVDLPPNVEKVLRAATQSGVSG